MFLRIYLSACGLVLLAAFSWPARGPSAGNARPASSCPRRGRS